MFPILREGERDRKIKKKKEEKVNLQTRKTKSSELKSSNNHVSAC